MVDSHRDLVKESSEQLILALCYRIQLAQCSSFPNNCTVFWHTICLLVKVVITHCASISVFCNKAQLLLYVLYQFIVLRIARIRIQRL